MKGTEVCFKRVVITLKINNYFTDGAMIQHGKVIPVTGVSSTKQEISIEFVRDCDGEIVSNTKVVVGSGPFCINLNPVVASFDEYTMLVQGLNSKVTAKNIVFGDVFLTSGQSNMALGVGDCIDKDEIMSIAANSKIRFLICKTNSSNTDMGTEIYHDGWMTTDNEKDILNLTAIGAVFASLIENSLNIPVGIIHTAVGGTPIESWMSHDLIMSNRIVIENLVEKGRFSENGDYSNFNIANYDHVSRLFNERIAPLSTINIKAILWLQGESSAKDEAESIFYHTALDLLINDWNTKFRGGNMFFAIDIASQNYQFAPMGVSFLNEAIHMTVQKDPANREHIPIYDLPLDWIIPGNINSHPIHPAIKAPVGKRLAEVVLNKLYGIDNDCAVPTVSEINYDGEGAILKFKGFANELKSLNGFPLTGFTVCGRDGLHKEAKAELIENDKVRVRNEFIDKCTGVTYAFSLYNQKSNLANSVGIPAVPFRSEKGSYFPTGLYHNENLTEQYIDFREWCSCDYANAWQNCFEWRLGGASEIPLWSTGREPGTPDASISFNGSTKSEGMYSLQIDYKTGFKFGYFITVTPTIITSGRFHSLNLNNHMYIDIKNPDNRSKLFYGVLVKSIIGKTYRLPLFDEKILKSEAELSPKSDFMTFCISLKNFLGCDAGLEIKNPADMSDVYEMHFLFRDESASAGTIFIDNIRLD